MNFSDAEKGALSQFRVFTGYILAAEDLFFQQSCIDLGNGFTRTAKINQQFFKMGLGKFMLTPGRLESRFCLFAVTNDHFTDLFHSLGSHKGKINRHWQWSAAGIPQCPTQYLFLCPLNHQRFCRSALRQIPIHLLQPCSHDTVNLKGTFCDIKFLIPESDKSGLAATGRSYWTPHGDLPQSNPLHISQAGTELPKEMESDTAQYLVHLFMGNAFDIFSPWSSINPR